MLIVKVVVIVSRVRDMQKYRAGDKIDLTRTGYSFDNEIGTVKYIRGSVAYFTVESNDNIWCIQTMKISPAVHKNVVGGKLL